MDLNLYMYITTHTILRAIYEVWTCIICIPIEIKLGTFVGSIIQSYSSYHYASIDTFFCKD